MGIRETTLVVAVVIFFAIGILVIHKITVARGLRLIGNAFIAAGDAVDHCKDRIRQLNAEERQMSRVA